MANQSASSSSTSQIPHQDSIFLNWELVNHTDTDDESIFAEVQSLDSFVSDEDETQGIGKSSPDRGDLMEMGQTQIEFGGLADGSLIVGKDIEVCDVGCDEGCDEVCDLGDHGVDDKCSSLAVSIEGDEGFGGRFGGSVDLGKNPFLEMETLHQFLGNAIEASHGLSLIRNECIPVEEVAFYNAVDNEMNVGGMNWNGNVGNDDDVVEEEVEEDEMDDVHGLDDELVPWGVADRFERQRMRKLGKRPYAKMTKSKKMPHLTIMRGCVRGKHGLGLKAY